MKRITLVLVVVVSLLMTSAIPRAAALPPGMTLGVTVADSAWNLSEFDQFETMVGKEHPIWNYFIGFQANNPLEMNRIAAVRANGSRPMITIELNGISHQQVINGTYDSTFQLWANQLDTEGGQVFLRIYHEFNGTWYDWSINRTNPVDGTAQTPSTLIAAWQHIYTIFQATGASNVEFVWCPNEMSSGIQDYTTSYPGDAYVTWTALDGYNWGTDACPTCWRSFADIYWDDYYRLTALSSRWIMIAEYGSSENGGNKATWLYNAFGDLAYMTQIHVAMYFSAVFDGVDWRVNSSTASLNAYKAVIQ